MFLNGREKIYTTTDEITKKTVIEEVRNALTVHRGNAAEEDYLFWYRRGRQPILNRVKQVRPEINNRIVENHAEEIVTFKDGYFLSQPAYYKSRNDDEAITRKVSDLNELLYMSGKHICDNKVVDWFHTVGLGVAYVDSDRDDVFKAYALDPRQAFVVYSRRPGEAPVMGVNMVLVGDKTKFDVFTKDSIYHLEGGGERVRTGKPVPSIPNKIISVERNLYGEIPIIEYQYNNNRMGAFESVIKLLDCLNNIESNAADGIEQFVQSLMVFYNCELGDDADGNQITPSYIREAGAIFLKSIGQDKADLKILTEQLDQTQTQVLKDNLYSQILHIVGMPCPGSNEGGTSDNVGAVIWRSGWYQADTYARNTEDLFKESNRQFDRVMLAILKAKHKTTLNISDFEIQFTRNETDTLYTRTQAAMNMKELGFSPEIAFARSGVSNDPVADVTNSKKYIELKWGKDADGNGNSGSEPGTEGWKDRGSESGTRNDPDSGVGEEGNPVQK